MKTAIVLTFSGFAAAALAAEPYDGSSSYPGGEQVCYQRDLYRTKWWANPGQSPADVATVTNAWESPWELTTAGDCAGTTGNDPGGDNTDTDNKADDGNTSCTASDVSTWDANAVYTGDDVISWNDATWRAGWWTRGEEPGTTGEWGVWRLADANDCDTVGNDDGGPGNGGNDTGSNDDGGNDDSSGGTIVSLGELQAKEAELTSGETMSLVKEAIATRDNGVVDAISPEAATNPDNVQRVESIMSAADWDYLFPRRALEYTYTNFLKAVGKFPAFCGDYDDGREAEAICRKSLAIMFAHFTQETGGHTTAWPEEQWRQGLHYLRELGWTEDMAGGYGICDPSTTWQGAAWPCGTFADGHDNAGQYKSYFGRGAKQLSYNYNYGPFSQAMFGDVNVLLEKPELVADTWLNLASAVFFFVYPQPPKPSMLHVVDGTWQPNERDLAAGLTPGFGVTTQIINGGVECGGAGEHIQSQNRIDYYENFARELYVDVDFDEVLGCAGMDQFDSQGSGALPIYWEQDWNNENACQLVSYQTQFSAFTEGDYVKCVEHFFDVTAE